MKSAERGVEFRPNLTRTLISIGIRRTGEPLKIKKITYDPGRLTCHAPSGATSVDASTLTDQSIDEANYSISCKRIGIQEATGGFYYPEVDLIVSTNRADFALTVPGDELRPSAWASEILEKINSVGSEVSELKQNTHLECGNASITSTCLLYTSPSPRDLSTSRMPSSA